MSYTKPHISDITSKIINYIDNVEEADNYIDWVTYEVKNDKNHPNYKQYTFSLENNNNVAATSQENIFTNENQNYIGDILAVSAGYVMNNQNNTNNILATSTGYEKYKTNNIVDECYFPNKNSDIDKKLGELEAKNNALMEEQNQNRKKIQSIEESINELKHLYGNVVDKDDMDINPQHYIPYDSSYEEEKAEVNKNTIYDEEQEQKKVGELIRQYQELTGQCITIQDNNKEQEYQKQIQEKLDELEKRELLLQNEKQKLLEEAGPPDNTRKKNKSNIGYNNQLLSINHVNNTNYYTREKLEKGMKRDRTIEVSPKFIINNNNGETINISSNRYANIDSYNQYS